MRDSFFFTPLFITTVSFPCLGPLILRAVRNSEAGSAVKLMNDSVIEARMQSQQPPKVSVYSRVYMGRNMHGYPHSML